jgi:hypothetical protein
VEPQIKAIEGRKKLVKDRNREQLNIFGGRA